MEIAFQEQVFYEAFDLVAYRANGGDVLAARIRDGPVEALQAVDGRPVFTAADGNEGFRHADEFVG